MRTNEDETSEWIPTQIRLYINMEAIQSSINQKVQKFRGGSRQIRKFKASLSHLAHLRSAWATGDCLQNQSINKLPEHE